MSGCMAGNGYVDGALWLCWYIIPRCLCAVALLPSGSLIKSRESGGKAETEGRRALEELRNSVCLSDDSEAVGEAV